MGRPELAADLTRSKSRWATGRVRLLRLVAVLICGAGLFCLLRPSALERAAGRVQQLGGRVLVEQDENGRTVQSVILIGQPISDAELASLTDLGSMDQLRLFLDGTKVTDAGLRSLAHLPGLRLLSMGATQVTDGGVAILAQLPVLERLSLKGCAVTDRALDGLAGMRSLRTLDLQHTPVTPAGVERLRKTRPDLGLWLSPRRRLNTPPARRPEISAAPLPAPQSRPEPPERRPATGPSGPAPASPPDASR